MLVNEFSDNICHISKLSLCAEERKQEFNCASKSLWEESKWIAHPLCAIHVFFFFITPSCQNRQSASEVEAQVEVAKNQQQCTHKLNLLNDMHSVVNPVSKLKPLQTLFKGGFIQLWWIPSPESFGGFSRGSSFLCSSNSSSCSIIQGSL